MARGREVEVDLKEMTGCIKRLDYTVEMETNLNSGHGLFLAALCNLKKSTGSPIAVQYTRPSWSTCPGAVGVLYKVELGKASNIFSIYIIFSTFNKDCLALQRKPKVIVIQAGQGDNQG